jgi:cystathionine beta-lyase/cystathionine gamma-synthase
MGYDVGPGEVAFMSDVTDSARARTTAVHAGGPGARGADQGSLTTPVHRTSGFAFPGVEEMAETFRGRRQGFIYSRYDNPSLKEPEAKLAALEGAGAAGGAEAVVFSSGMAAITAAMLAGLGAGDHILAQLELYGGTTGLITGPLASLGIGADFIEAADLSGPDDERIERRLSLAARETTRVVYLETPANPTLRLVDLAAVSRAAHRRGWSVYVDSTFATPINQRPLALGADVIVHSATKYLAGHDDLTAGFVVARGDLLRKVRDLRIQLGGCLDPSAGWLLARSMKTLALRVAAQNENAMTIARHLEGHRRVASVSYPGLASHPDHDLARRQMSGFGGILSFDLLAEPREAAAAAARFIGALRMIPLVPTLGGLETSVMVPAASSHIRLTPEERRRAGIGDGLVRLSAGIEDPADILADLDQALG